MQAVEESESFTESSPKSEQQTDLRNAEQTLVGFSDEMMDNDRPLNQLVYVADKEDGYALGRIVDLDTECLTVRLEAPKNGELKVAFADVLPAVEDQAKDVNDNCSLMYLNEGTLLHNCRLRYNRKQIYTYVANILISINPYEQLSGLYSSEAIRQYRGKSLGQLPPHIFAIADKAYREMKRNNESQSIVVSGESGAGKTECQKSVLRYLCENWSSSERAKPIENLILETNPILEAFGNAKTLRNNNSSRFGKFVEIHFNKKHEVVGGFVSHYLLEKSRITSQAASERNYHVFFQLIAGADQQMAEKLGLASPDKFKYLNQGCTQFFAHSKNTEQKPLANRLSLTCQNDGLLVDDMVDDFADFQRLCAALNNIGIGSGGQLELFRLLAGILHLGNIEFEGLEDLRGGCVVTQSTIGSLEKAAVLLGLNVQELSLGLTTRLMQPTRSGNLGTLIQVRLKPEEARAATDALAKATYSRLFDHIVVTINSCIPFGDSSNYIGVLDIAGFEFFKTNSFEQFCINYTNEKLQMFFNDRILKQEQELYAAEGLNVPRIDYASNDDAIELFESKGTGLLELLNEEARLPRGNAQHFTVAVHQANAKNKRLMSSRTMKEYRDLREDQCFIVRHYAADVCYQTEQFLLKNSDALHASLETLMEGSKNLFITKLFNVSTSSLAGASPVLVKNKLVSSTVSSKFRAQLGLLVQKLENTGTHFVRCIKPNTTMAPGSFNASIILSQLRSAGMANVLRLMQMGYPSRTMFSDLYEMYAKTSSGQMATLEPRLFCKCIFHALGLNDLDYKFGVTKVFFRAGKFRQFDELLRHDNVEVLMKRAHSWLNRIRWRKAIYCVLSCIKIKKIFDAKLAEKLAAEEAKRLAEEEAQRLIEEAQRVQDEEAKRLIEEETQRVHGEEAAKLSAQQETEKLAFEEKVKKLSVNQATQATPEQTYDVHSWSYAKLRDAINTETVIELIEACRVEFRRRLAVYRAFKLANAKYQHTPQ